MKSIDRLTDAEFTELAREASRLPDAPQGWVDAAVALWAVPQLALGVRSMAVDNRHLLYSARGRDIDVRVTLAADRFSLSGQILGPDESGEVELSSQSDKAGPSVSRTTQLDELGEFRLDGVDRGTYLLTLRMGVDEIVLPPIVIGERSG
jgi:hypothetical protein